MSTENPTGLKAVERLIVYLGGSAAMLVGAAVGGTVVNYVLSLLPIDFDSTLLGAVVSLVLIFVGMVFGGAAGVILLMLALYTPLRFFLGEGRFWCHVDLVGPTGKAAPDEGGRAFVWIASWFGDQTEPKSLLTESDATGAKERDEQ